MALTQVRGGQILDASITEDDLSASVAGDGLGGGAGSPLEVNVDGMTLEITADTLNVKDDGIGPDQLASTAVTAGSYVSANITVDEDGRITAAADGSPEADSFVDNEIPLGDLDGVDLTYVLDFEPDPSISLHLYLNGVRQHVGDDFSLATDTITWTVAPIATDLILADYRKALA